MATTLARMPTAAEKVATDSDDIMRRFAALPVVDQLKALRAMADEFSWSNGHNLIAEGLDFVELDVFGVSRCDR